MDKKLPQDEIYEIKTEKILSYSRNLPVWDVSIKIGDKYYSGEKDNHTEYPYEAAAKLLEESVVKELFA